MGGDGSMWSAQPSRVQATFQHAFYQSEITMQVLGLGYPFGAEEIAWRTAMEEGDLVNLLHEDWHPRPNGYRHVIVMQLRWWKVKGYGQAAGHV